MIRVCVIMEYMLVDLLVGTDEHHWYFLEVYYLLPHMLILLSLFLEALELKHQLLIIFRKLFSGTPSLFP